MKHKVIKDNKIINVIEIEPDKVDEFKVLLGVDDILPADNTDMIEVEETTPKTITPEDIYNEVIKKNQDLQQQAQDELMLELIERGVL